MIMLNFPQLLLLWTAFFVLAFGLPMLFVPKRFAVIIEKSLKNLDIVRIRSFLAMIVGFLFLSVYQKFDNGRAMYFSIFGYLSLIKGLMLLRFPSRGKTKYRRLYATKVSCAICGAIVVLFAAFMVWMALVKF